jgi:hypothetical protein
MEVATTMPAAKISIPQRQALDTLARAGGVMARRHLISAVWRATSSTVSSLIKRDLLIGDGPGAYPRLVQLTPDGWAHTPRVMPGEMEAAVWDEARREHEHRYPAPQTVSVNVPMKGHPPEITVANDGPWIVLNTHPARTRRVFPALTNPLAGVAKVRTRPGGPGSMVFTAMDEYGRYWSGRGWESGVHWTVLLGWGPVEEVFDDDPDAK